MATKNKIANRKVELDLCPPEQVTETITLTINLDEYIVDMMKNINRFKPTRNKKWQCVAAVIFTEAMRQSMIEYSKSFKGNTRSSNAIH